jgi:tetratricopeptide (TPR) repeat protein
MPSTSADVLADQGIAALQSGQSEQARELLTQSLQLDPHNIRAWLWLSGAVDSPDEQRYCLEQVLALDPHHEAARRGLQSLAPEQTAPPPTVASSSAGAVTARLTLPDDFAFSPVAAPIVSSPLGTAADQDAAAAFVVRELGQFRRRDEIIRRLAERQQWSWDAARQFLSRVEITESGRIARRKQGFWLMIGGVALLGVVTVAGLVAALVVFLPAPSYTTTSTPANDADPSTWRSYFAVAAGIFTILGAMLDWDWFMHHPRARFFVAILGRTGARVFYMLLGCFLLALGLLISL